MPEIFQRDYPALSCVQACKVYAMQHDYSGPLIYQYDDGKSQTVEVHIDSVVAAKVLTQRETASVIETPEFAEKPKPSTAPESVEPEYRMLGIGEVVQSGDLVISSCSKNQCLSPLSPEWESVAPFWVGRIIVSYSYGLNFCRKVEPVQQPALPAYNPGPHPPIPEGWYAIGPDEVIASGDRFGTMSWLHCKTSIGQTPRHFRNGYYRNHDYCYVVIRKKPTRWRACKTLSEFEPFWGKDVVQKHNGKPERCYILSDASGCTMEWYFLNYTTLDGKPIGVEEVVE